MKNIKTMAVQIKLDENFYYKIELSFHFADYPQKVKLTGEGTDYHREYIERRVNETQPYMEEVDSKDLGGILNVEITHKRPGEETWTESRLDPDSTEPGSGTAKIISDDTFGDEDWNDAVVHITAIPREQAEG